MQVGKSGSITQSRYFSFAAGLLAQRLTTPRLAMPNPASGFAEGAGGAVALRGRSAWQAANQRHQLGQRVGAVQLPGYAAPATWISNPPSPASCAGQPARQTRLPTGSGRLGERRVKAQLHCAVGGVDMLTMPLGAE